MIATEGDLPMIVELAREAHVGSVWEEMADFDAESCEASVRHMMASEDQAVFVSERGVMMVARVPVWFNHAETIACEVFYYATKGGDALRREAQAWAGSGLMTLSRHDRTDARLDKIYGRAGFKPLEHTFIRRA